MTQLVNYSIIAVTGLAAHAFGSWAHSARNMWLRDYLPRDIKNARVMVYGYPSHLQGNMSRSILSDYSTNLIHRLLTMRESAKVSLSNNWMSDKNLCLKSLQCQDRPIVFIGHSLGCLIIKKVGLIHACCPPLSGNTLTLEFEGALRHQWLGWYI